MGLWAFYFLAKTYLYFRGYIYFDFILNLLFAAFLIAPIPKQFKFHKALTILRNSTGLVLAFVLLWHDSWLPQLSETLDFVQQQRLPKEYIYSFLFGLVNFWEVTVLGFILAVCLLVRKHLSLTPLVIFLIFLVPLRNLGQDKSEVERYLDFFYQSESRRVISFKKPSLQDSPFDIIILHICSLSWRDLKDIGLEGDPFFKQFDYLLTNFNSVTSYTNPSAIRLLRANCGQPRHDDLYRPAEAGCYLFDSLRALGYETYFTFNFDSRFGDFAEQVRTQGHLEPPLQWTDLPIQQYNFDGSRIYDNYAVLERWWWVRQRSKADQVALYHDNTSLHDGTYWAGEQNWWKRDRAEHYREFVEKLFRDLTKFFDLVASSGRNAVIIFVPEHGMALSGSKLQAAGIREIPLPQITTVPVGIKLIGLGSHHGPIKAQIISKPTSYLALSQILASFIRQNPFGAGVALRHNIVVDLPETEFVSENQGARIIKQSNHYLLQSRSLGKEWIEVWPEALDKG